MKRTLAFILALTLLFSLSIPAFADGKKTLGDDKVLLTGKIGKAEGIRSGASVCPFYLDKPVVDCDEVKLVLSVTLKSGICTGNYYLYVKDADDNWHHPATFKLQSKKVNGQPYTYELELEDEETFVAVAIWPADKGMDFSAIFDYSVYVDPDCISEYSDDDIMSPMFEPEKKEHPVTSTHFSSDPYHNPWF